MQFVERLVQVSSFNQVDAAIFQETDEEQIGDGFAGLLVFSLSAAGFKGQHRHRWNQYR